MQIDRVGYAILEELFYGQGSEQSYLDRIHIVVIWWERRQVDYGENVQTTENQLLPSKPGNQLYLGWRYCSSSNKTTLMDKTSSRYAKALC